MESVDLINNFIGRYRMELNGTKWYLCIFYHWLHITMANALILHKSVLTDKGIQDHTQNSGVSYQIVACFHNTTVCFFTRGLSSQIASFVDFFSITK